MAHAAQREFCCEVKRRFPEYFRKRRVLEVGSLNINGGVRNLFQDCAFIGIDCIAGKGVDVVCPAHEYDDKPASFDVVCSTESLEHDPYASRTVATMLRLLRPGGLLFVTCAADEREEHGTARTGDCYGPDPDFYRNVSVRTLFEWLCCGSDGAMFQSLHFELGRHGKDLYCHAIKS
jgi:SAM-dependent methyltransferase